MKVAESTACISGNSTQGKCSTTGHL